MNLQEKDGSAKALFGLMASFRKFPKYQLERRLDIFIALFLEDFLRAHFNDPTIRWVAPEFPLKHADRNLCTNVDYVFHGMNVLRPGATAARPAWLFVELKTDVASFDAKQFQRYLLAQTDGMAKIVDDIAKIREASDFEREYDHLLGTLAENPAWHVHPIELVYLAPQSAGSPEASWISLESFAAWQPSGHLEIWSELRSLIAEIPAIQAARSSAARRPCPHPGCSVSPTGKSRMITHLVGHGLTRDRAQALADEAERA